MLSDDAWLDAIDDKKAPHRLSTKSLEDLIYWYETSHPLSLFHERRLKKLKETLLKRKIRGDSHQY